MRGGRLSWPFIAGWIVLLLSCSSTVALFSFFFLFFFFFSPLSPDSVFVTLFWEAVEIAGCGVRKLFRTSEVPTSLTLDFIVLTVAGNLLGLYRSERRLVECCFTSTETVDLLGTGAQDDHLDFHTASEL